MFLAADNVPIVHVVHGLAKRAGIWYAQIGSHARAVRRDRPGVRVPRNGGSKQTACGMERTPTSEARGRVRGGTASRAASYGCVLKGVVVVSPNRKRTIDHVFPSTARMQRGDSLQGRSVCCAVRQSNTGFLDSTPQGVRRLPAHDASICHRDEAPDLFQLARAGDGVAAHVHLRGTRTIKHRVSRLGAAWRETGPGASPHRSCRDGTPDPLSVQSRNARPNRQRVGCFFVPGEGVTPGR